MKKNLIASVAFVALSLVTTAAYAGSHNGSGGEGGSGGSAAAVALSFQKATMEVEDVDISKNDNDSNNKIDDYAFKNAKGAFQIQQNTGTNVQQQGDVTVAAIIGCDCADGSLAVALSSQKARLEIEDLDICKNDNDSRNRITDSAFKNAQGAFSIQQNTGTNVQQQSNVTVAAVIKSN